MTTAVILGSAYRESKVGNRVLIPESIDTPFGKTDLYKYNERAWIIFRHGIPRKYLPNQIPYRRMIYALKKIGCTSILTTSSAGILNKKLPLDTPIIVSDILTLDNRLPDGSSCTMFEKSTTNQGHLLLNEGLISNGLTNELTEIIKATGIKKVPKGIFGYVSGPRTKTRSENIMWQKLGADINSMTLAPEVILANEMEIPVTAVVIGHKYSTEDEPTRIAHKQIDEAFNKSRNLFDKLTKEFIKRAPNVQFKNKIYRY